MRVTRFGFWLTWSIVWSLLSLVSATRALAGPTSSNGGALLPLLVYFIFGVIGTFGRMLLSPTLETGVNRRTIVETVMGGITGMVLPYAGAGLSALVGMDVNALFAGTAGSVQVVLKGALIALLSYAGSLSVGEILARRAAAPK